MSDSITLDRKAFRALSSDTRINILKILKERRMTLSELAKAFGMSPSTIKEHLDALSSAELVEQKDEGRKWKYYELTKKGSNFLSPSETKVFFILGASMLALSAFLWRVYSGYGAVMPMMQKNVPVLAAGAREEAADTAAGAVSFVFPYIDIGIVVLSAILLGACLGMIVFRKKFLKNI